MPQNKVIQLLLQSTLLVVIALFYASYVVLKTALTLAYWVVSYYANKRGWKIKKPELEVNLLWS